MNIDLLNYRDSPTLHKKRSDILQKTYRLFLEEGIRETTMVEIAKASNITRRTLYNYYNNKEEIAEDLQIMILHNTGWFVMVAEIIDNKSEESYYRLGEHLLTEHEESLRFINLFRYYFSQQSHTRRYNRFINNLLKDVLSRKNWSDQEKKHILEMELTPLLVYLGCLERLLAKCPVNEFDFKKHQKDVRFLSQLMGKSA